MTARVPITRPALGAEETEAAVRVIRSGWLTQGPEVAAFETEFAAATGAAHAVAVCNCTVAIELALRCAGVRAGDDVVTVSHSFIATANAVVSVGARPVFCDVERDTFGMAPASLEATLTRNTKAVLCVHQLGMPCDLPGILEVAARRGVPVIEDAACAIGSELLIAGQWERLGRPRGVLACFSLHPRKIVTTGDGGMLTTSDPALAARLRLLRQHAMSVPDTVRHHSDKVVFEQYTEPAFNYRMTDLQACVGRPQLARLHDIVRERRRLADQYAAALHDSAVFEPPRERPGMRSNWQSYPLTLRPDCGVSQLQAMQTLMDQGVACKRGIGNAHQEPAYADRSRWACGPDGLPVSEQLRDTLILIPLFHGMTPSEQARVIEACLSVGKQR